MSIAEIFFAKKSSTGRPEDEDDWWKNPTKYCIRQLQDLQRRIEELEKSLDESGV